MALVSSLQLPEGTREVQSHELARTVISAAAEAGAEQKEAPWPAGASEIQCLATGRALTALPIR